MTGLVGGPLLVGSRQGRTRLGRLAAWHCQVGRFFNWSAGQVKATGSSGVFRISQGEGGSNPPTPLSLPPSLPSLAPTHLPSQASPLLPLEVGPLKSS